MNGFAIIKIEADAAAVQEDIVAHFNDYMQATSHDAAASFVGTSEGYFRISYDDRVGISSAGITAFGNFLQSAGYGVNGMGSIPSENGASAAEISFSKSNGKAGTVRLSTERVY
ncbi:MAG: hypothetical protein WC588_00920 [Candidatus Micrarchaeia archaeon]